MKRIYILFLFGLLFLSGCVLEYREGLPAVITISEMPKQEMESMLCDSPPCATLVQMSQIKRTQYVCSSQTKGANDDPRGTTYNTQLGGDCTPLEKPTTVCLKYDCDFNKEEGLGYYEIEMIIGNSGSDKTKKLPYTGVALPYEKLVSNFRGGSLGRYGEDNIDFYYSFLDNQYKTGKYSNEIKIESKNYRSLSFYTEQKCLANMPIKYPYNSIDFAYNPIFESERNKDNPTKILRNLQTDYTYLSDYTSSFFSEDGEVKPVEDPCSELCNSVDEGLISTGVIDENKQEECNTCQENRKEDLKQGIKDKKATEPENMGGYSYNDLSVKTDENSFCTGLTPCVEIDRVQTSHEDDSYEERYFVCQCACEIVTYANYVCTRAGDSAEYFYTGCEKTDVTSDQGGYMFSVHGFEAELFKNVLGNSENKMLTFMVGQGSTFEEYIRAREECEPEITADVIVEAGNKRLNPSEVEVFSGSSICFKNDGVKTRKLYVQDSLLANLSSGDSVCYETGPDTNFELGKTYVYVDDSTSVKFRGTVNVIEPTVIKDVNNKIKLNENGELKFFYNNEVELSTLYASAPFSKKLSNSKGITFDSYDSGEFFICDEQDGEEVCISWIAYETDVSSMTVHEYSLYNELHDFDSDGYVDIYDYLLCAEENPNPLILGSIFCSGLNSYFSDLTTGSKKFDYPVIKKNMNYLEFTPSAITLPLGSKLCISNPLQNEINLILEMKTSPSLSNNLNGFVYLNSMKIPSPTNYLLLYGYENINLKTFLKYNSETSFTFLSSLRDSNKNYKFVQAQSVASGLECCFTLGEPGVYKVSSLYGLPGSGHIIVFPNDVGNTITLNDYEYSPEYVTPIQGDFICINNPYDFDRVLSLEGDYTGTIDLPSRSKVCSYDWANKKDNTIHFVDTTTGGYFDVETINSSILNIEVVSSNILQSKGQIQEGGTVCFINNDEADTKIYYSFISQSTSQSFILEGNSMNCSIKFSKGLYKISTEQVKESLIVAEQTNYYLFVGNDNEGYIYNKTFYGSPLTYMLEKFEDLSSKDVTLKPPREISITSSDNIPYHLYSQISFNNKIGFTTISYYLQTPEIIFENTGKESLTVIIYNYGNTQPTSFILGGGKYIKYDYKEGDYKIELEGKFEPSEYLETRTSIIIDSSRMLISKDVKYISDYSLQTFTLTSPIKFKNNLKFNVSSSLTQRVYYGKEVQSDTPLSSNPIYGYFVIESTVDSVSELEMQKTSGNYNNLDFGVQILNGVPSSDILLQAKKMLAYDDSLPVFVYSRIGNIELKLDNPYKTEVYEIPKGANVSYVISDWILDFKKGSSSIRNAYVSSSVPVIYGETNHNILKEDVDFTIDTGTGKKIVKVLAVDNSKTVVMDYTPFNVEVEGTAPYKYVLNNLAYEPRAFTLMPQNTKDLCIEFNGKTNLPVNLNNIPGAETAAYMKLYNIEDSGDLNQIQYHDDLLSTSKTREISDILILVNYGLNDVQINLNRLDAGGGEVGELYLAPDTESTNTLDFNFISGFISGLNETKNVRAYRFYGDESKFKLNVDSKVYESPYDTEIDSYSILARAFTTNDNPTSKLLNTANVYLRMKDVKAVPNKWYMAGLADTTFSNLVKGYDTYNDIYSDEIQGTNGNYVGEQAKWVDSGCGDFLFIVPFNNELYPQAFAYDVPEMLDLNGDNRESLTYMRTINMNYKYAIQKVEQRVNGYYYSDIELSNGEIINDVRMKLSENPYEADYICGYYNPTESFEEITDFAGHYDGCIYYANDFENPFNYEDKDDFEFDVESNALLTKLLDAGFKNSDPNKKVYDGAVMIYTPTGMYCGWGGGSGRYCNDTDSDVNCLTNFYTNEDFCNGYNYDNTCLGNIGSCLYITDIYKEDGDNAPILDNCNEKPHAPADKSEEDKIKEYCTRSNYWISVDGAGNKGSSYPNKEIDYVYDRRVWWCRYNVDAFAHETSMLPSAGLNTPANEKDIWSVMEVKKLSSSIGLEKEFDTGVSYNPTLYDFMSDGYFDIYEIDKGKDPNEGVALDLLKKDRGDKDDLRSLLLIFYSSIDNLYEPDGTYTKYKDGKYNISNVKNYDKGLSEDALTNGLFFMLNTVDTGDYFFSKEVNTDYVEKVRGYVLSSSFMVSNNEGRKLLCVGADTFNGNDVILGAGANEQLSLDLSTNYNVYEPAYYANLELSEGKTFSHVSLFAHSPISDYTLGTFDFFKPLEKEFLTYIDPEPEYKGTKNIELYDLNVKLKTLNGEETFDVIDLTQGQSLTLENTGDADIVWYYAPDDLCNKGFTKLLNDRYTLMCSMSTNSNNDWQSINLGNTLNNGLSSNFNFINKFTFSSPSTSGDFKTINNFITNNDFNLQITFSNNYDHCINNPELYSLNPSDIMSYLDKVMEETTSLQKVIVKAKSTEKVESENLKVLGGSTATEYLFYNPHTGKRFTVIVSSENYVIDLDVNTFSQDSVNVFDNSNTQLCFKNYDGVGKDLEVYSSFDMKVYNVPSGTNKCLKYSEFKNNKIIDPILGRELNVILSDFSDTTGSSEVIKTIGNITKKVTENTPASNNPAYNFLELNVGASATPSIITTEIIDYKSIMTYNDRMVESVAQQVYAIVSNSKIKYDSLCEGTTCYDDCVKSCTVECTSLLPDSSAYTKCFQDCLVPCGMDCFIEEDTLPSGSICTENEILENEKATVTSLDPSKIDCNELKKNPDNSPVLVNGKTVYKYEDREKCEATKQAMIDKIAEIEEEIFPYTVVNEDRVLAMLPILIKYDNKKTNLTTSEIIKIKSFIDDVNERVDKKCESGNCDNEIINTECSTSDDTIKIANRYLDMIGFIVLIDDPGIGKRGNCSFIDNYLDGVMDISIYAATTNLSEQKYGMPSMIIGFGVNRNSLAVTSCWDDLDFKKEIEELYTSSFMLMLDKGIIGLGHYCLRDGECKPITTGIQGADYGLFKTTSLNWEFKPIILEGIKYNNFIELNDDDKSDCIKQGDYYFCNPLIGDLGTGFNIGNIDVSGDSSSSGIIIPNSINLGLSNGISLPGIDSSPNTGLLTGGFNIGNIDLSSGIGLNTGDVSGISFGVGSSGVPVVEVKPDILENAVKKTPYGQEWFDRCGRYYYKGEGMTMIVYPEKEVAEGQQGKSCNPGRVMELYKEFNC